MIPVRIDHARPEPGGRLVVFSDVHGDLRSLRQALQDARLTKGDLLITVGDYVERGPDSLGVLRFMMELGQRFELHACMGNVDAYLLFMLRERTPSADTALRRALAAGGGRFVKEARRALGLEDVPELHPDFTDDPAARLIPEDADAYGPDHDAFCDFRDRVLEAYPAELAWLESLPAIVDTPGRIYVHGGLPHENLAALAGTDSWPLMKNDCFVGQGLAFSRTVVVGHWPATLYRSDIPSSRPFYAPAQRILSIDGGSGVKPDGEVNVLVFPDAGSDAYELYSADGLPEYRATEPQEADTPDPFSIHWGEHYVRVLRREGDCALVRQLSSGRTLWIPESFIFEDEHDGCPAGVEDSTNYRLPIAPGDRVKLVCRCSRGCVVKHDGVTGWYSGTLEPV